MYDSVYQICSDFTADIRSSFQHFWKNNTRDFSCISIRHEVLNCAGAERGWSCGRFWDQGNSMLQHMFIIFRSSRPEVFLGKGVLKISSKFNRRSPMPKCDFSCNFIEIAPRHVCSPVNLLHIFRIPFPKNSSGCRAVGSSSTLRGPNLKRTL